MEQARQLTELKTEKLGLGLGKVRTVAITSGKGGVGKTNVVVNLAVALARRKVKVAVLDADYGLGNIDILLGLEPGRDIADLLQEKATLEDILVEKDGMLIIPATSGIQSLTRLTPRQEMVLHREMAKLERLADILIIDTAAGISDNVISLLLAADEVFLVVSSEPTSIVDAYAVVKVVGEIDVFKKFAVIANQIRNQEEADEIFRKISTATRKFLNKEISSFGAVHHDRMLTEAVRAQKAVAQYFPDSRSARDFDKLARILLNRIYIRENRSRQPSQAEK